MNKAIFFDRDGVLDVDTINLYKIEDWQWIDGAREAIKLVNDSGYLAILITNQSGIAKGLFTEDDVDKLHDFVNGELKKIGAHLDGVYVCPHHPEGTVEPYNVICDCRKPKPGLVLQAVKDFDIDVKQSVIIGDKQRDLDAGLNAGCRAGYLFDSNGNLYDFVKNILDNG